ncbi:hypothetical protein CC86DRAFT_5656 [Ophiobolus disseminans]|uniref:F-box domain-containing protein n=1 Tax=Ophiobolus disseminans TaxID=1469910 RepID=A0A6A7AKF1_9PLEO|nr:hypothetical protein CC86DRAFT_5656 [Ophiobolus disseminans]
MDARLITVAIQSLRKEADSLQRPNLEGSRANVNTHSTTFASLELSRVLLTLYALIMSRLWRSLFTTRTPRQVDPTTTSIGNGRFPVEILAEIFSHLTFLDLFCCRLACRLWSRASYSSFVASKCSSQPPWRISRRVFRRHRGLRLCRNIHDLSKDSMPVLYVQFAISMERAGHSLVHNLRVVAISPFAAQLNPVLCSDHAALEYLTKHHYNTFRSPFNITAAKWPPEMAISIPAIRQLAISVNFNHELSHHWAQATSDTQFRQLLHTIRSYQRIERKNGLKVEHVVRHIAKQINGMKKDMAKDMQNKEAE